MNQMGTIELKKYNLKHRFKSRLDKTNENVTKLKFVSE